MILILATVIIFLFLPCIFWISADRMETFPAGKILRSISFLFITLLETAGGVLLYFVSFLGDNYDYGKRVHDILKIWEKDPSKSIVFPPEKEYLLYISIAVCVLFLSAVIITAFLAVRPHKNRYLFLYILLPLLAFPVTYFSLRIHKERKEDQYFFHYLSRTEKILHDSRCSKEKKMEFIRSCRENFPVTYEKPLWKNINSFPEKFEKGLEK